MSYFLILLVNVDGNWHLDNNILFNIDWDLFDDDLHIFDFILIEGGDYIFISFKFDFEVFKFVILYDIFTIVGLYFFILDV